MSTGLLEPGHKKVLRFFANKSQQLWLLSLKYANYRLTFVNKMFPALPQLTMLPCFHITLKNQLPGESVHPPWYLGLEPGQTGIGRILAFLSQRLALALPWDAAGTSHPQSPSHKNKAPLSF